MNLVVFSLSAGRELGQSFILGCLVGVWWLFGGCSAAVRRLFGGLPLAVAASEVKTFEIETSIFKHSLIKMGGVGIGMGMVCTILKDIT